MKNEIKTDAASMDIKLNFINQSNDSENVDVVVFQKNEVPEYGQVVAWEVIENCGRGDNHPFTYPSTIKVSANDSYGNYTPQMAAEPGDTYAVVQSLSGDQLVKILDSSNPKNVVMKNQLPTGSVTANIYRGGKRLAIQTNIAPEQMAAFKFKPTIYIGVVPQVTQGEVMDPAIVSQMNTSFSLLGMSSADIVMTGGGTGSDAQPYSFSLQYVVMD
jgi:hypothetical protein